MNFYKKLQFIIGNSRIFQRIDEKLCGKDITDFPPPIFLVGVPRVGSTLLYQVIIAKYETAYLTNLHSLFYSEPCLAEYIVRFLRNTGFRHSPAFKSNYGFVSGVLGPSEAGPTFRHWFGEADFNIGTHQTDFEKIWRVLSVLCSSRMIPFVSKNLFNSMRLGEILKCFPDAFLVWMRRDMGEVVRSIIKMREELCGDTNKWVSVKVPHWEELQKLPPRDQVVNQIETIEKYIEDIFKGRNAENCVQVNFADLCERPENVVDFVMVRYSKVNNGRRIPVRNSFSPELFQQIRKK